MQITGDGSKTIEETLRAMNELTGWESCKGEKQLPHKESKRDKK